MIAQLKNIVSSTLHLFYPHVCTGCGSDLLQADNMLCLKCIHNLPHTNFADIPNNPVEKYLGAIEEHQPDILGMSALLTTTMPYMKVVIDTMKEKGIRDDYVVLVGGAPLNEEFAKAVGADAYCRDAAVAVETAKDFMARRHNQQRPA